MPRANARRPRRRNGIALLLIDVVNTFDFPRAEPLIRAAKKAAPKIESLAASAREAGVPVVYVNDNFGQWSSDFRATVAEFVRRGRGGPALAEQLRPREGDYFVLKPQHSGFYATPLALLLDHLGTHTLVLAGFATNICVLFTANDAHMRGFHLVVPRDCAASNTPDLTTAALKHVRVALTGKTPYARQIDFARLGNRRRKSRGQAF